MRPQLIAYHNAYVGEALPAAEPSLLLEYVTAANGVYARGIRPGLEVLLPVSFSLQPVRGLAEVESYARFGYPKVPAALVSEMLRVSREVCRERPTEALFYLLYAEGGDSPMPLTPRDLVARSGGWWCVYPEQEATDREVRARAAEAAIIELHSHHAMKAEFSPDDNEDEQMFRVYCVVGAVFEQPTIRARVGLFGHFMERSAAEFFELPDGLIDSVRG